MPTRLPAPDPTATRAWGKLAAIAANFAPNLRDWFARDPNRARNWSFQAGDLRVDLSKNLVDQPTLAALLELAEETGVLAHRDAMFAGERVNVTENRRALHTALRRPLAEPLVVDGKNVVEDVHQVLADMREFANRVHSGHHAGVSGKKLTQILNLGIGGSDLGPKMVSQALTPFRRKGMEAYFVSNLDPTDIAETLRYLDPETTLIIVSSKSFTTQETLMNAQVARDWLVAGLCKRGLLGGDGAGVDTGALGLDSNGAGMNAAGEDSASAAAAPAEQGSPAGQMTQAERQAIAQHFAAVSTNLDKVAEFGISPDNTFGFWEWVGGRYSVDSAIGLSLMLTLGADVFAEFLDGFHILDQHFLTAKPEQNVPLLMGLLNVWYTNFLGAQTHAVFPYSQYLRSFPAYLKQLTMESNGKGTRWDGQAVACDSGEIFWGEVGSNGQHSFFQLLHQGTRLIPADFIGFANPTWQLQAGGIDMHDLLLANLFAQTRALAFGKIVAEVKAEGTPPDLVSARVSEGNKPSTTILAPALTPSVLGQIIALYEHIVFVQGAVWGIDSFDQWGIMLGKAIAQELLPMVQGTRAHAPNTDSSTLALIQYYREHRKY